MSTAATEPLPADALELRETITLAEGGLNADGTITLDLIRPCVGKGKGTHIYEADMLSANAGVFTGWKMYVDHLSDQARRQLGGLPRSIRDLGGRITESWWDASVPADPERGFGQGAVRGKAKPTPFVRELVENDPEIVELSINGNATTVRPAIRDGRRGLLVEGIRPNGSVDWVTEAGAGGRVVSLMEAAYNSTEDQEAALLESLSDDELHEHIVSQRPALAALLEAKKGGDGDAEDAKDGGADEAAEEDAEFKALVKKFTDKGMPQDDAEKAARKAIDAKDKQTQEATTTDEGGDEDVTITPEALREALSTDEGKEMLLGMVREQASDLLAPLVEAAVADERDLIQAQANAHANRQIELRDLRDYAGTLIESAKLPEGFADQSKKKFSLTETGPTDALDVIPEVDADGNVVKTAKEVLTEAVNTEIAEQRSLVSSLRPTRVVGQGAGDGDGGEGGEGTARPKVGELTASLLQEAGFSDPDKVYEPVGS